MKRFTRMPRSLVIAIAFLSIPTDLNASQAREQGFFLTAPIKKVASNSMTNTMSSKQRLSAVRMVPCDNKDNTT